MNKSLRFKIFIFSSFFILNNVFTMEKKLESLVIKPVSFGEPIDSGYSGDYKNFINKILALNDKEINNAIRFLNICLASKISGILEGTRELNEKESINNLFFTLLIVSDNSGKPCSVKEISAKDWFTENFKRLKNDLNEYLRGIKFDNNSRDFYRDEVCKEIMNSLFYIHSGSPYNIKSGFRLMVFRYLEIFKSEEFKNLLEQLKEVKL